MNLGAPEIRQVQIALKEKGFYRGEPDGVLGPETTQAIITFQQQQGFQANGRIDKQTVTALGVSNLSGTSTTGQTGNTVQQPANQNVGAGQQGTQGGNQSAPSTAGTSGANTQPPANQNSGASQQGTGNQPGSQPSSTTGQSGQTNQPSPTNQTGTNSQPAAPAPQSNSPNRGSSK
jgi:peptidoglycan hydrolase-like protein with peptidoglycan-binding domain